MFGHSLRCNSLDCRARLTSRAVVTTCSHVFCEPCAQQAGLTSTSQVARTCLACQTRLANADDVVLTLLSPSEDYKTSVLSGLSPQIVMECAGRALSFWTYQATQEILYQEHLVKVHKEENSQVNAHMDKIIGDANGQLSQLNNKIRELQIENTRLRRSLPRTEDARQGAILSNDLTRQSNSFPRPSERPITTNPHLSRQPTPLRSTAQRISQLPTRGIPASPVDPLMSGAMPRSYSRASLYAPTMQPPVRPDLHQYIFNETGNGHNGFSTARAQSTGPSMTRSRTIHRPTPRSNPRQPYSHDARDSRVLRDQTNLSIGSAGKVGLRAGIKVSKSPSTGPRPVQDNPPWTFIEPSETHAKNAGLF